MICSQRLKVGSRAAMRYVCKAVGRSVSRPRVVRPQNCLSRTKTKCGHFQTSENREGFPPSKRLLLKQLLKGGRQFGNRAGRLGGWE